MSEKSEDKSSMAPTLNQGDRFAYLALYDKTKLVWHGGTVTRFHPKKTERYNDGKGSGDTAKLASVLWDPYPEGGIDKAYIDPDIVFNDSLYDQKEVNSWIHSEHPSFNDRIDTQPQEENAQPSSKVCAKDILRFVLVVICPSPHSSHILFLTLSIEEKEEGMIRAICVRYGYHAQVLK
jgi:hypothetical protein